MKRLFLFLMVLIGFSSIASAQKTEVKVDYMESSALYLEPTQSIMTTPLIADLSVVGGHREGLKVKIRHLLSLNFAK